MANPDDMKLTTEIHTLVPVEAEGWVPGFFAYTCSACSWGHGATNDVREPMDYFETHHAGKWIRFASAARPWYRTEDGRRINWAEDKAAQATISTEHSATPVEADPVNHPAHYGPNSRGVECIDAIIDMNFPRGSAVKYIWRAGAKGDAIQDLRKAIKNIEFEIERLENLGEVG